MRIKTVAIVCDICTRVKERENVFIDVKLPVNVSCSQDDGAPTESEIRFMALDVCKECMKRATVIDYGFRSVKGFKKGI